jgi:hypothetical protein
MKILLRSLCGVSAESQIHVPNLLAYDRGYGSPGKSIHETAVSYGCQLLGTAQRNRSFQLTFEQATTNTSQKNILEVGSQVAYWVSKCPTSTPVPHTNRMYGMG